MGNRWGGVKRCQNIPQLANMFGVYAARVVLLKSRFSPLWRILRIIPHRNVPRGACQEQF
jgi:hypothetical protein